MRERPETEDETPDPGHKLSGKQRRFLRAKGHHLDPVVQVGKEGISDPVITAVDEALGTHELIKVRLGQNMHDDRHAAAAELAARTGSEVAQVLGSVVLLYRAHPEDPEIELP